MWVDLQLILSHHKDKVSDTFGEFNAFSLDGRRRAAITPKLFVAVEDTLFLSKRRYFCRRDVISKELFHVC